MQLVGYFTRGLVNICFKVVRNFLVLFAFVLKPVNSSSLEDKCEFGSETVYSGRCTLTFPRYLLRQSFIFMREADVYSDTSVYIWQNTSRCIPADSNLNIYRCTELTSVINALTSTSCSILYHFLNHKTLRLYPHNRGNQETASKHFLSPKTSSIGFLLAWALFFPIFYIGLPLVVYSSAVTKEQLIFFSGASLSVYQTARHYITGTVTSVEPL
jgi:hypothetical protein